MMAGQICSNNTSNSIINSTGSSSSNISNSNNSTALTVTVAAVAAAGGGTGGGGTPDFGRAREYFQKGLQSCPDCATIWRLAIRLEETARGVNKAR